MWRNASLYRLTSWLCWPETWQVSTGAGSLTGVCEGDLMSPDCRFLSEKLIEQRRHSEAALLLDQYAKVRCIKFMLNGLNLLSIT